MDRSANQQNFRILVDTSRLTMERLEGVTSDAESRAVALAAISRSLPDNATLGQRLELLQKLTNLMKTATRNVKRNPMEAIYAGYYVLKESGMVTGIEVTWDILCSGMYFCWGTDPEQSPPMRMDRIVSTGCVPDCTPSHFQNFENGGEIYTFDAKKDYAHAFLPSRNSNDSRIVWIPATQETEGESSKQA